jgi:GWxTD domain-containing protein
MPDRVFLFMPTISKICSGSLLVFSAVTAACGGAPAPHVNPEPDPRVLPAVGEQAPDISELYRQIGLIAAPNPVAFVGKVSAFASKTPDTTLLLVSISLPNRALTFSREGDRYRAPYEVNLVLNRGSVDAGSVNVMEIVRVGSFREINRSDESVIFQHYFHVAPGLYTLSATVRDVGGSRSGTQQVSVSVPMLGAGGLSTPLLVYEAKGRSLLDSAPNVLASPRSSAVFGRDSTVAVYVEAYGSGARLPVDFTVRNDKGVQLWRDSVQLARNGSLFSGIVSVPISAVGVGTAQISFSRRDVRDSVQAPLFVSFGEDIPLMSFEDMVAYLRFFANPGRLNALRSATPEQRATMWAEFLRATDPIPETATNEDMQAYFNRIQIANLQFRPDHNPGWLSDRGMVFVALGEPDQITERNVNQSVTTMQAGATTTRLQVWQYRQFNSQLVFYDEMGRWKLTRPSETEFLALNSRRAR